jgi:hypothetical protein
MIVLEEKLYTSEETAEILGVNPRTLYRYLKKGDIQAETKTKSGTFRFTRTQIYKYLYPDKYSQIIELLKSKEKSKYVYLDHSQVSNKKQTTEHLPVTKKQPVAMDSIINQNPQPSNNKQNQPSGFTASEHLDLDKQNLNSSNSYSNHPPSASQQSSNRANLGSGNDISPKQTPANVLKKPNTNDLSSKTSANQPFPKANTTPTSPASGVSNNTFNGSVTSVPVDKDKLEQIRHERSHKNLNDELESLQTSIQGNMGPGSSKGAQQSNQTSRLPNNQDTASTNSTATEDWKYYLNSNKDILQLSRDINSLGTETGRKYASTMKGGLSLHQDLEEFNLVHFYVEKEDLNWWVSHLELSFARPEDANICLIPTDEPKIFDTAYKLRGLNVVSDDQLIQDLMKHGEKELAKTLL